MRRNSIGRAEGRPETRVMCVGVIMQGRAQARGPRPLALAMIYGDASAGGRRVATGLVGRPKSHFLRSCL